MFGSFKNWILPMLMTLFLIYISIKSGEIVHLACRKGTDVYFECPCCPDEMDTCRFKKLLQRGFIAYNASLNSNFLRFEFDGKKAGITLKDCAQEDEGAYAWMCGTCNLNHQFQLEIYQELLNYDEAIFLEDETLECPIGRNVHFTCPCPKEINSCRFEKDLKVIAQGSNLLAGNLRFKFDENDTGLTLNKCEDEYEGVYNWICHECGRKMNFWLKLIPDPDAVKPKIGPAETPLVTFKSNEKIWVLLVIFIFFIFAILASQISPEKVMVMK